MMMSEVRKLTGVRPHGLYQTHSVIIGAVHEGGSNDVRSDAMSGQTLDVRVQHVCHQVALDGGAVSKYMLDDKIAEGVAAELGRAGEDLVQ
eukprot:CAMPEP_0206435890 /NCGR_PEP_ID=MMETSP0324_2-20121206/10161_1 /ASSEMBLY_ACC=CAM_ASM_000836 /TAXON_ID=2866 /ORGANISM="Crypthecodinium cohnii, Strain Seligo" /LENGTH=90 /DNA_ID=CAMNT_0053902959 /DNA_START=497 /DNA_END=766 /DNA_ORIENTATION=+